MTYIRNHMGGVRILAFLFLALMSFYSAVRISQNSQESSSRLLYKQELNQCLIAQSGRLVFNQQIVIGQQKQNAALVQFAQDAASARLASYNATHLPSDLNAATQYIGIAKSLSNDTFKPLPIINCYKTVKKP